MRNELLFLITKQQKKRSGLRKYATILLGLFVLLNIVVVYIKLPVNLDSYRSGFGRLIPFPAILVGGDVVYTTKLEREYEFERALQESAYRINVSSGKVGEENLNRLKQYVIEEQINTLLLADFLKKTGMTVDENEVTKRLGLLISELGTGNREAKEVVRFVSGNNYEKLRSRTKRRLMEEKIESDVLMQAQITVVVFDRANVLGEKNKEQFDRLREAVAANSYNIETINRDFEGIVETYIDSPSEYVLVADTPDVIKQFIAQNAQGQSLSPLLEDKNRYYLVSVGNTKGSYAGSLVDLLQERRKSTTIRVLVP